MRSMLPGNQTFLLTAFTCCLFLVCPTPRELTAEPPVVLAVPANEEGLARFRQWKPITDYLSDASGLLLVLEMVEDHPAILRGLAANQYDLAFVDPVWYVTLVGRGLCVPLARPVSLSRDTVRSLLIVHRDSIIRDVSDLGEAKIALTGRFESALGYYLPLSLLESRGLRLAADSDRILFSDTFLSILKGVAYGKLEAGFVSSSVLDEGDNASLREQVRVVLESEAIPQWTLVYRSDLRPSTIASVRRELLNMVRSEQGRPALQPSGFSAFVEAFDADYDAVRRYREAVEADIEAAE
ncbi:MAG: phosphate/phosphite/phosphonate ABC transporter substrate-binding protein [Spirochaetales bacterium]|nr:phosphate/phosphite/phosphonate ABC transporter substrate-binding protein [Spirochaetales bacterium]